MKTVIFTMGTRGDVQPYIFLSRALMKNGYEVTLGSHPCWRALIEDAGVTFAPIGPDINIEEEASIIRGKEKSPMAAMLKTISFIFKIVENSSGEIYDACKGMDLVIVSHSHMGAVEAKALNIPVVDITLQTEMLPEILKPRSTIQKIQNALFGALVNPMIMKPYNKIMKKYGLPKVRTMDDLMSKQLNLIPISRYVLEPSPYWAPQNVLTGFWYDENPDNYEPSEELKKFLVKGDKPIVLALGAMSFETNSEKEKFIIFMETFQKTGKRAIIQGFKKTLADITLPESMIAVDAMPHSYLFKQAYCVIHHGGFGTSASALIYGAPAIIVPHALDQFGLADRYYKLGVTTPPIKASELSIDTLIDRIVYLEEHYNQIKLKVDEISGKIAQEHGLDTAIKLIDGR